VILERAGKVLGVGTVLNGDGRILTALSPLTHGNNIDARYPDGSVSRVRLGHTDRGWDLALLIPQNSHWRTGLKPAKEAAVNAGLALQTFSQIGKKNLALSRTIVKGTDTLLGGDSLLLRDALDLASQFKDSEIGTPIVDAKGDVVAVVAKACAPNGADGCRPVAYGVPVSAIKAFLRTVPSSAVPPAPWLGIQGTADDAGPVRGVRVLGVHPSSPAAAAGLHGGADKSTSDTVVAIDGAPVLTPEALAGTINTRAVGDTVRVLLYGGGKYREVSLVLKSSPEDSKPAAKPLAPKVKRSTSTAP
jgi:serine protease Do